ncbi:hypothetical protein ACWCXH_14420 [Kitasatospora sp. NPDC001660]
MTSRHQSVRDYIEARKAGGSKRCEEIVAQVRARYDTRTTDSSELRDLYEANMTHPLAQR